MSGEVELLPPPRPPPRDVNEENVEFVPLEPPAPDTVPPAPMMIGYVWPGATG